MAKVNAIFGKATGKVGALVFQVSGGVQIMKEKPTNVSNPQTDAQVAQRAKLKLMSQLAADMSNSIAFRKQGLVSARNQFISANIGKATYANNEADIDLTKIDLTGGSTVMPAVTATVGQNNKITIALAAAAPADVARVVYCVYKWKPVKQLSYVEELIVETAGANRTFSVETDDPGDATLVLAYGIKDNSAKAELKFQNYHLLDTSHVAAVEVLSSLSPSDYTLTQTVGVTIE